MAFGIITAVLHIFNKSICLSLLTSSELQFNGGDEAKFRLCAGERRSADSRFSITAAEVY